MNDIKKLFSSFFMLPLVLFFFGCSNVLLESPRAEKGVLDLTNWDFKKNGKTNVDGEWEFYWQEFKNPQIWKNKHVQKNSNYIKVTSAWNSFQVDGSPIGGQGYATYRLRILLPEESIDQTMSFMLRHVLTSYRIYVNGELLSEVGTAGKSRATSSPAYSHQVQSFVPQTDVVDIVLHVSNFFYARGGLLESFFIGTEDTINQTKFWALSYDLFLLGTLLIMSFYHFGLFFLRRKTLAFLFFGLFTFIFSFRILTRGEMFINAIYPNISFVWQIRLEYLSFFLAVPVFFWFLYFIFPKHFSFLFGKVMSFIVVIVTLFILFTPPTFFTHLLIPIEVVALLSIVGILVFSIQAAHGKEEGARFLLFTLLVFASTSINDLLYFSGVIHTIELTHFGIFFLIFSQAFVLSHRVATMFSHVEKLSFELDQLTLANSRFVPEPILNFLDKGSIIEVKLGDHVQKKMGVLFLGIDNFYEIIEKKAPQEQLTFINSYLNHMAPIIREHKGFIDKYSESGFMAIFPHEADDLIKAVIHIEKEINNFQKTYNYQDIKIKIGAGAHIGDLMLGTVGEEKRIDVTVISDAVNISSRMKDLTKNFSVNLLVSEQLKLQLKNPYHFRKLGTIPVKGKTKPIAIFEVLNCYEEHVLQKRIKTYDVFAKAIDFFEQKKFDKAKKLFAQVKEKDKKDRVVQYYLQVLQSDLKHDMLN